MRPSKYATRSIRLRFQPPKEATSDFVIINALNRGLTVALRATIKKELYLDSGEPDAEGHRLIVLDLSNSQDLESLNRPTGTVALLSCVSTLTHLYQIEYTNLAFLYDD